ncbi:MAG: MBL fold metallo-hydrolase [Gemmatimonadota bacterium]|nr:MBL fold metallo-hydrolase [Gemmatimonadota bacterium]
MRVKFWGTRGSLAKPGPDTVRYGGNTSCVSVESASGTQVVLDCGTGAHAFGQELVANGAPMRGHLLISHTHWDHIQGLPFFAPLFVPGGEWDVYGPHGLGGSLKETLAGQMQYTYFPITLDALGATVRYHNLGEGAFQIGDIRVRTRYLNHPALTLGYRLEADGVAIVYACDHEPHTPGAAQGTEPIGGQDQAHAAFLAGADLVIHDAQYTSDEYPSKRGWGHSTHEYAVEVCRSAGVERLAFTHHDPLRGDDALDALVDSFRAEVGAGPPVEIFAAAEGQVLELTCDKDASPSPDEPVRSALDGDSSAMRGPILVGMAASPWAKLIAEAAAAEGIHVDAVDPESISLRYVAGHPALVILDDSAQGRAACRWIRSLDDDDSADVPIILVGAERGDDPAVTDWLVHPFSVEYARARIRAWLERTPLRWARPPLPENEAQRLDALHGLDILDTSAEDRFDRITRLAAALLGTPVSLVSLIDDDRQWFKSVVGVGLREGPRESSFCAHAILDQGPFVIPNALEDDRFADNPFVTGPPHIRFYAGCPLVLPDGHGIGTLCVLDDKARQLSDDQLRLLRDLADMVQEEFGRLERATATAP